MYVITGSGGSSSGDKSPRYVSRKRTGGSPTPPAFDPATLPNLEFWLRGSYTGDPWVGTASAGGSGSRDATSVLANTPDVGETLNGFACADFIKANQDYMSNIGPVGTYQPANGYFRWILMKAKTISTTFGIGAGYFNEGGWGDSASYLGDKLAEISPGQYYAQSYHWDGAGKGNQDLISLDTWFLWQTRYDGAGQVLENQLNGNAILSSSTVGNVSNVTGQVFIGAVTPVNLNSNVKVMDLGMIAGPETQARFADIRSYINSRYGTSY
jgi:hypothetical protein